MKVWHQVRNEVYPGVNASGIPFVKSGVQNSMYTGVKPCEIKPEIR